VSTAVTPNEMVGKQKQTTHGRGGYPERGSTHGMHSKPGGRKQIVRSSEMKGFKDEIKREWHDQ
jgi:hypothetical protein